METILLQISELRKKFLEAEIQRQHNEVYKEAELFFIDNLTIDVIKQVKNEDDIRLITLYLVITKLLTNEEKDFIIQKCKGSLNELMLEWRNF